MQINLTSYQTEISERIEIYRKGLSQCRKYLLLQQFEAASICGLKSILQCCNGAVPETDDLIKLADYCEQLVEGFPKLNLTSMPIQETVIVIEGILIERQAFYKQLENLTH
ncbi:MAG: hypothetical protein EPO58_16135 [Chitinophagaceae bacterium]|nr:MAG: hypothetical protein EPO58_16135 [Chitinophagaceae bacterium]